MKKDYAIQHQEITEWRRGQIANLAGTIEESEEMACIDNEAMQAALNVLQRWLIVMKRDVESRVLSRRGAMMTTNRMTNGVFDWRNGVEGDILQERIARLQHFEYSITDAVAVFDEVSGEGLVAQWIDGFSH